MIRIKHPGTMVAGFVFMLIGAAYLLEAFDVWDVKFRIWPLTRVRVWQIGSARRLGMLVAWTHSCCW